MAKEIDSFELVGRGGFRSPRSLRAEDTIVAFVHTVHGTVGIEAYDLADEKALVHLRMAVRGRVYCSSDVRKRPITDSALRSAADRFAAKVARITTQRKRGKHA